MLHFLIRIQLKTIKLNPQDIIVQTWLEIRKKMWRETRSSVRDAVNNQVVNSITHLVGNEIENTIRINFVFIRENLNN